MSRLSKIFVFFGIIFLLSGFLLNQWMLSKFLPFFAENLNLARSILLMVFNLSLIFSGIIFIKFRSRTKKLFLFLGVFALMLASLLGGLEAIIRMVVPSYKKIMYFSDYPFQRNPFVGIIHKPRFEGKIKAKEFEIVFKTNSQGFRSEEEFIAGDSQNKTIAVLGDSFVEALEVREEDSFVKLLEGNLKNREAVQVQNYGVSNLGIVHYLQMYKYYVRQRHPEIVIIAIFPFNDFKNSSPVLEEEDATRPNYILDKDGKIKEIARFEVPNNAIFNLFHRLDSIFESSAAYQTLLLAGKKVDRIGVDNVPHDFYVFEDPWRESFKEAYGFSSLAFNQLIGEIKKDSALPIVVLLPSRLETNDQDWQQAMKTYSLAGGEAVLDRERGRISVRGLVDKTGVLFLDLTQIFKEEYSFGRSPHFPLDGHLNAFGHRIVAESLTEEISKIYYEKGI